MKANRLIWALGWVTMGSLAALQGCGGDDDDGGDGSSSGGEAGEETGGTSSGGSATGGRGGSTGGSTTGGSSTGGSTTGGSGGAPGGMGGDDTGGGGEEAGGGSVDTERQVACTGYCDAYFLNMCETFDSNTYDDSDDCQSTCEGSDWEIGVAAPGDTINCRAGNAAIAVGADREMRCEYASENSSVCM